MNDGGKSDKPVVPAKGANKGSGGPLSAERVEGRGLAKGNPGEQTRFWTQGQIDLNDALDRIRKAAKEDKGQRFTALWHHVYNVNRLRQAYCALKRTASPGVDGQTWVSYGHDLETNLKDLSGRLQRGAYRAQPVKRVYIPKADGRQRPHRHHGAGGQDSPTRDSGSVERGLRDGFSGVIVWVPAWSQPA